MDIKEALNEEISIIKARKENISEGSYTSYLFNNGLNKILKKIGEEATEVIIAAKEDNNKEVILEICDLIFHLEVLMVEKGLDWHDVANEVSQRRKKENMNIEKDNKRKAENRTDKVNLN